MRRRTGCARAHAASHGRPDRVNRTALNSWRRAIVGGAAAALLAASCPVSRAATVDVVALPAPRQTGGMPLMDALHARQSIREFSDRSLPPQMLSDLLWAAFGINRPAIDHRTAPSTMNMQEIDVYLARADGFFLYAPKSHELRRMAGDDVRPQTGGKPELQAAAVVLIFVADLSRMTKAKPADRDFYAAIDTGFISQNVYLFAASAGLATVVHELDRAPLVRAMSLRPDQRITIVQSVGYPKR